MAGSPICNPPFGSCLTISIRPGRLLVAYRAGTNTPSDEYDSYRGYRVANANTLFSQRLNFIRQCSKFHTVIMLSNFINLTIIEMNELTIFYQHQL